MNGERWKGEVGMIRRPWRIGFWVGKQTSERGLTYHYTQCIMIYKKINEEVRP